VPIAVVELAFDPIFRLGDASVRIETVALAVVILVGLLVAALIAARTPAQGQDPGSFVHRPRLRLDDLLFIVVGIVPGAVIGGRIGHALLHVDFYAAQPFALLDPAHGSLELIAAVVGGSITGASIARLLGGSVGRWLHIATLPTLLVLALGKAATALGGFGQGSPSDLPWATAYMGGGPWGSLAPATPSHPAQLYEALIVTVVVVVLGAILAGGGFARRDGRAFLVAIALWAAGRALVGATWRDAAVAGPLNAGQLLAIAVAAGAVLLVLRVPRVEPDAAVARGNEPSWPDPETRPQF
jgi:prolipoprotein diacylglyceryltransferase